jgi:hypothetical protein
VVWLPRKHARERDVLPLPGNLPEDEQTGIRVQGGGEIGRRDGADLRDKRAPDGGSKNLRYQRTARRGASTHPSPGRLPPSMTARISIFWFDVPRSPPESSCKASEPSSFTIAAQAPSV